MKKIFHILFWVAGLHAFAASRECMEVLRGSTALGQYTEHLANEYEAMRTRIGPTSEVDEAFHRLIRTFHRCSGRIRDPMLEGYYIRGVLLWASTLEELNLAERIFSMTPFEIEIFAARMAYFSHHFDRSLVEYPTHNARAAAVASLGRFDMSLNGGFNADPTHVRPMTYNPRTGRVTLTDPVRETVNHMRRVGINVHHDPVGGYHFNNGRYFHFLEHPVEELWAARQIGIQVPHETLLGYGDPSVRNFLRVLHMSLRGRLRRIEKAADFLFIRRQEGHDEAWEFCIREYKGHAPKNDVEVEKALQQLTETARDLAILHPRTPVAVLEIVVPERGTRMATGYRRSDRPIAGSPNVYSLLDGEGFPVYVEFEGERLPVRVRMIPLLP